MVVEAARGLGEAVVSGEVDAGQLHARPASGVVKKSQDRRRRAGAQRRRAAPRWPQMGQQLAELHGSPQDIEWAFDAAGDLYLLQSRPITTI